MKLELKDNKVFFENKGLKKEIHPFWLRERVNGENFVDKSTQQRLFDPTQLPEKIQIKDLKREKCIGQVVTFEWKRKGTRLYKLEMLPTYPDKRDFMDTLVHEMVHLYQMQNLGDTGNHNDVFWSFSPKVNYVGLRL